MDERRQLPRWQVKRQARVWLSQAQELNHCIIEDLNLKGMRATFDKRLPKEDPVNIFIALEDNVDFMKIEAHLPWVKEEPGAYVYGMLFSKIMDQDKDKIYHYISSNCFQQFKERWWSK